MKEAGGAIKGRVLRALQSGDAAATLEELKKEPLRKVINPLFVFIQSTDEDIKWAAVTAMGEMVSKLADEDLESARVILRRLMWNLNDESGGIGWGSAEAMGEILSRHAQLADEFFHILLSYAREDGNYLEYSLLQRGMLWAIGRVIQSRPYLLEHDAEFLLPFLESEDAEVRALSVWIAGLAEVEEGRPFIEQLKSDWTQVRLYLDEKRVGVHVAELAKEAIERINMRLRQARPGNDLKDRATIAHS